MTECCPLCGAGGEPYHRDDRRRYERCLRCGLVFVPRADRLDREAEFAEYRLHQNSVTDPGYRRFLSRLKEPLCERLDSPAEGLDFGCGPAPALADMLTAAGHVVQLHDSFFAPAPEALNRQYDFITATEVVEHLHQPGEVLNTLWGCLRVGGLLAVMTKLVRNREAFSRWHYIRDPTHVCFFSEASWRWWAARRAAGLEFVGSDVIILRRQG